MVPSFRLDTVEDERFYLEDHRQDPVVLVFWATWCRSCKKEMAALETLHRDPRFRRVVFAAVCTDPEQRDKVRAIVDGLGISYTALMDPEAHLYNRFQIQALPFTMLIEPGGRLSFAQTGYDGVLIRNLEAKLLEILQK
jgi:peroxiredoxin